MYEGAVPAGVDNEGNNGQTQSKMRGSLHQDEVSDVKDSQPDDRPALTVWKGETTILS